MKKKTRCYIYTRVSTAIQVDGYSLDAQKDKLRKYAEFQDMEIVGEYSDEGHSGKNIKGRQEFMRMLNDIEDGKDGVDFVLVFKLSRFGRNAADVLSSLQLMQDYGVNLICEEDWELAQEKRSKIITGVKKFLIRNMHIFCPGYQILLLLQEYRECYRAQVYFPTQYRAVTD